jgi:RNA polymerase sigma-70 factor (ECF subfamily)
MRPTDDMYMKTDDNELAAKAGNGDAAAFQLLVERHYDSIYRIALRFTGMREDAEDLAQDVCSSLARKLRTFKGEAQFTTWLYRVVVNAVRDLQRKQAVRGRLNRDYGEMLALKRGEEEEAAREQAWLYEMLNAVGQDLRETAIMVLAEDLSHAEAAEILMIKESTVSWRMHELRKKLKALAEQET